MRLMGKIEKSPAIPTGVLPTTQLVVIDRSLPGFFYVPEINRYVLSNHYNYVQEILVELSDPNYKGKPHGKRHTRCQGCVGPLCRYAQRVWAREHRRVVAAVDGRIQRPRPREQRYREMDKIAEAFLAEQSQPLRF